MKVTRELIESMVRNEIVNLRENVGKPTSALITLLRNDMVKKVLGRLKEIMSSQGEAGASTRVEEVAAICKEIGVTAADLRKVIPILKGEEDDAPDSAPGAEDIVPAPKPAGPKR